jgi:ribonuclease VapC
MVLDTSAIVAAVANEVDCTRYQDAMRGAAILAMSSVPVLETRVVLYSRYGTGAVRAFDALLEDCGIFIAPFDRGLADLAFDGFRRYGKGQGHPAQLNIIDCVAYALARSRSEPLLFKGGDFAKTDIDSAL